MGTAASLRCVALSGHNTLPLAVDPVLHTTRILGVHKMERKKFDINETTTAFQNKLQ
jgi:hypothetical protein